MFVSILLLKVIYSSILCEKSSNLKENQHIVLFIRIAIVEQNQILIYIIFYLVEQES